MTTNDRKETEEQTGSTRQVQRRSGKQPPVKKPSGAKNRKHLSAVEEQVNTIPSANGEIQPRIAERAYELYQRRGGHHGQDLDDWFLAEQEIMAEDL